MKTVYVINLFLVVTYSHIVYPQFIKTYGVKVGTTYSTYNWKPKYAPAQISPDIRNINSYNYAVYGEFSLFSHLSLISQIEYSRKGAQIAWPVSSIYDSKLIYEEYSVDHLSYISFPILIKVRYSETFPNAYIFIGPRIDYLISRNIENIGFQGIYDNMKHTVYGASMGLGIQASSIFYVEGRYNVDYTNSSNAVDIELRNTAFDLWIGFGF